jgi:hypothetical protein
MPHFAGLGHTLGSLGHANPFRVPSVTIAVSQKSMSPQMVAVNMVVGISAFALLAGCASPTSTGTLMGTFQIVTGGVEYRTVPGAGYIVVRQGTRRLADHKVSSGGAFNIPLPAGSLQISSTCLQSPHESQLSVPKTIQVEANMATRADVQCLLNPTVG